MIYTSSFKVVASYNEWIFRHKEKSRMPITLLHRRSAFDVMAEKTSLERYAYSVVRPRTTEYNVYKKLLRTELVM